MHLFTRILVVSPALLATMLFLQNCSKVAVSNPELAKQASPQLLRTSDNGEGNLNPGTNMCGGPGNADLYNTGVQLVKAQSTQRFSSYGDCQAARAAYFGNAYVCSKMVAATIFGCLPSKDHGFVVLESDFALPVFKATNQMEVPYDYYLNGVPNCEVAKNYLNTFTSNLVPTVGYFTEQRADIRAECLNSTTVLIHILRIY